ncbi:lasso peptide biosynthesis PqqD family chaperone [Amycolatopsis xylanica]|nr:lasso peptide biosynthesis PqqD family chaperone [Amycolatopsis xylanica]
MRLHADVSTAVTDYGTIMLDERSGRYWQLSPVGALVVEFLSEGKGIDDAIGSIVERFDVDESRARSDVNAFIGKLRSTGLVRT